MLNWEEDGLKAHKTNFHSKKKNNPTNKTISCCLYFMSSKAGASREILSTGPHWGIKRDTLNWATLVTNTAAISENFILRNIQ